MLGLKELGPYLLSMSLQSMVYPLCVSYAWSRDNTFSGIQGEEHQTESSSSAKTKLPVKSICLADFESLEH